MRQRQTSIVSLGGAEVARYKSFGRTTVLHGYDSCDTEQRMISINDPPATRDQRHAMVSSQLRTSAVSDTRVVTAMASVPREDFLPADAAVLAYRDTAIPLGHARAANTPLATGRLLTAAELEAGDRVLLIGAAGGYTAALLAGIVGHVTALEVDASLVAIARRALAATGNVTVAEGPLAGGYPANAPYDVLIVDGAVEQLPAALVAQVRVGGRVVTGLVERGILRLASGRKTPGGFGLQAFADRDCVVLPGFAQPQGFRF